MSKTLDVSGFRELDVSGFREVGSDKGKPALNVDGFRELDVSGFREVTSEDRNLVPGQDREALERQTSGGLFGVPEFLKPTPAGQERFDRLKKGAEGVAAPFQRGSAQGAAGRAFVLGELGVKTPEETASEFAAAQARAAAVPKGESQQALERDLADDEGVLESVGTIVRNPLGSASIAAESFAQMPDTIAVMLAGLGLGAGAGAAVGGPAGAAVGGAAGTIVGTGIGSGAQEYGSALASVMAERKLDPTNEETVKAALANPEVMAEVRRQGIRRGVAVGTIDAISAGLAGKFLKPVRKVAEAAGAGSRAATGAGLAVETGVQGVLGGTGEAAAQLLDKGEITDPGSIALEGVIELGTGAPEIALGVARNREGADPIASDVPTDAQPASVLLGEELDVSGFTDITPPADPMALRQQANDILAGKDNPSPADLAEATRLNDEAMRIENIPGSPVYDPNRDAGATAPSDPNAADGLLLERLAKHHNRSHIDGMQPGLKTGLAAMIEAAPPGIREGLGIGSGYRSVERQAQIYAEAVEKYGSEAEARKWAAPPGRSQHNHGNAADLSFNGVRLDKAPPEVIAWVHENAGKFGLAFPLGNEAWHVETAGARSGAPPAPAQANQTPAADIFAGDAGAGVTAGLLGIPDAAFDQFAGAVSTIEGARWDQMGGSSGRFAGKFQMGDEAITDAARELGIAKPSVQDFLRDPPLQKRMFDAFTARNHRTLMQNPQYAAASPAEKLQILGYAHNQGAGGAIQWLNTGVEGRDAFGTSGKRYFDLVGQRLGAPQASEMIGSAADVLADPRSAKELRADVAPFMQVDQTIPERANDPTDLRAMLEDPRSAREIREELQTADVPDDAPVEAAAPLDLTPAPSLLGSAAADTSSIDFGTRSAPIVIDSPESVNLGAEITAMPTPAQAEAGNYRKRRVKFDGLDIAIETEAGMERTGVGPDGVPWSVTMPVPYGDIKGTKGADGDPVDVYLGGAPTGRVFVVDQIDSRTGKYDEAKVMLGFTDESSALAAYERAFSDGRGRSRIGASNEMTQEQFRQWLAMGRADKPVSYVRPRVRGNPRRLRNSPADIVQFLAQSGGIQEFRGELGSLGIRNAFVPGVGRLVRAGGMSLDRAREIAAEAGYLGIGEAADITSVRDLLEALDANARGQRVFSHEDTDAVAAAREREASEEDARVRGELDALVKETGANLRDGEVGEMLDLVAQGESVEDAFVIVIERNAQAFLDDLKTTAEQETPANERIPFDDESGAERSDAQAAPSGEQRQDVERGGQEGSAPARDEPGRGEQGPAAQEAVVRDSRNTDDGAQAVLPGAERISQREEAERAAAQRNRATVLQKDMDVGMFGSGVNQTDLLDIRPQSKPDQEPAAAPAQAEPPATPPVRAPSIQKTIPDTPQARRAINIMGGARPGDRVTISAEVGVARAGDTVTITSLSKKGHVYVTGEDGASTSWSPADMIGAQTRGVTFDRTRTESAPVAEPRENVADPAENVAETPAQVDAAPASNPTPEIIAPQNVSYGTLAEPNVPALGRAYADSFASGEKFATILQARKMAGNLLGGMVQPGTEAAKRVDEAVELGAVMAARQIVAESTDAPLAYDALVGLYGRQPSLNVRTSTSVANQAYSTPVPLAFVAGRLAGVGGRATVYEPSAGNGALLIASDPSYAVANEFDPARSDNLEAQGFSIVGDDATDAQTNRRAIERNGGRQFDVVIANPPFGVVKEDGRNRLFDIGGGRSTTEIDHAISLRALETMKDDGRAVLLIAGPNKLATGEARSDAYNGKRKREFFYSLYGSYNVVDHFTVAGELYSKQGAAWPIDVIVINGKGKSARSLPAVDVPRILSTWDEVKGLLDVQYDQQPARQADGPNGGSARGDQGRGGSPRADANVADAVPGRERTVTDDGRQDGNADGVRGGPDRGQSTDVVGDRANRADGRAARAASERADADGRKADVAAPPPIARTESAAETAPALDKGEKAKTKRADPEKVDTSERQVAYRPKSKQNGMGTLVPVNMQTTAQDALSDLQSRVGDLDEFVARELGIDPGKVGEFFAAEQVDGIALGIDNFARGAGMVIGDQTGIGKGRQVAGILRWAIRNSKTPIFVTEKPNLYADMVRDLEDVGVPDMLGRDLKVLMTNAGETVPLNEDGSKSIKSQGAGPHGALLRRITAAGKLDGFDTVFTTYSQMQTVKGQETDRMRFIRAMTEANGVIVFDEAHNAGGQTARPAAEDSGNAPNRAQFARELLPLADAVLYSSATYAKRPDVMDLYAKTDMRLAVDKIEDLGELIAKGGVPMQQVVAAMLSQSGQYVRRERSFDGVVYDTPTIPVDRRTYGRFSESIKAIQDFSEEYVATAKNGIDKEIKAVAKSISADNSTGGAGATSTNFTSIMHNVIGQMLLSISADRAADLAIESIRAGEKPVITLANTLESFVDEYASENGIAIGDPIALDFRGLLLRYLERTRILILKKPYSGKGESERHRLTDAELGPDGVRAFKAAQAMIRNADFGTLPVSPVDWIKSRIRQAGFSVGEITGRTLTIDYAEDGTAKIGSRPSAEKSIAGRRRAISAFNGGTLDAMILNQAGSTGLSLHASERVKDQRRRHMIIAQAEQNIDTHMQMLGRVHRTGQVITPRYSQLVPDVPASKRPASVLAKKMASLNASTTASRDSAMTAKDVPDFINEYGDKVAVAVMQDNPDIHAELGMPLAEGKTGLNPEDAMRRVTGRIPLLPIDQQESLYDTLESEYAALLQQVNAAGENALEAKTLDLDARSLGTSEVKPSKGGDSPFAGAVYFERIDVKRLGKPMSWAQVSEALGKRLNNPTDDAGKLRVVGAAQSKAQASDARAAAAVYRHEVVDAIKKDETRADAQKRADKNVRDWMQIADIAPIGSGVRLFSEDLGAIYGVVLDVKSSGKTQNPIAMGSWKVTIATVDASRQITFAFSQLRTNAMGADETGARTLIERAESIGSMPLDKAFDDMQQDRREERTVVTGNILAGYDFVNGRGSIVNFTDDGGRLRQGVLMRRDFDPDKFVDAKPIRFNTPDQVASFLQRAPKVSVRSSDGFAILRTLPTGDVRIATDAGRGKGGTYYLNKGVLAAAGRDFVKVGSDMRLDVPPTTALRVMDAMQKAGAVFETREERDVARAVTGAAERFALREGRADNVENFTSPSGITIETVLSDRAAPAVNAIEGRLRAELDALGLRDVALRIADSMRVVVGGRSSIAEGMFLRDTITVAMDAEAQAEILHHEALHALREFGLFTPAEWSTLEARAASVWMDRYNIAERYAGFPAWMQTEEAVARAYQEFAAGRSGEAGVFARLFNRIRDALAAIRRAFAAEGFQRPNDVFRDIRAGRVGNRPRAPLAGEQAVFQRRSVDGDLFTNEIVETTDGPRSSYSDPTATGRPSAAQPRSPEALLSMRREPEGVADRQRAATGFLARGAPIDRAMRLPFDWLGGLDEFNAWDPGKRMHARIERGITEARFDENGRFAWLNPMLHTARAGLIDRYGLDKEYVLRDRARANDERRIMQQGAEILKTLSEQKIGAEESRVLQAMLTDREVSNADMEKLAEPIRVAIDQLGQEAVALGLISRESYERNRGAYLNRSYLRYESEMDGLSKLANSIFGRSRKKIIGNQLKGRGIFLEVDAPRLGRDNAEWLEARRGNPQKGDRFRVLDELAEQGDALDDDKPARVMRRVYWPADQEVPVKYAGFRDGGVWEARTVGEGGRVTLWRDYTKAERGKMGEILDARYNIGKTYMQMSHDLATGRFFKDIAENEAWSRSGEDIPPDGTWLDAADVKRLASSETTQWVRVPATDIPGTGGKKRWGALSGRFVRAEIWRDLNEVENVRQSNFWRRLLQQWKLNKTVRNPVVHMNNVMSNLMFMDLADVRVTELVSGLTSYAKGDEAYQEAVENGAFGTDMISQEIRKNVLQPLLKEIQRDMQNGSENAVLGRAMILGKIIDRIGAGLKAVDGFAMDAYRMEDEVFRMAAFVSRRSKGATAAEAALYANEQFLDYDIRAPWVNAARNTVLPFISYVYRAVPVIAKALAFRPWKIAKYYAIAYGVNAMAYALTGDDEEDDEGRKAREIRERGSLRKEEQGQTWIGAPRLLRMPWDSGDGLPVFLDIRRWIPAGDVFDVGQGSTALPIPAPLMFGGPLMLAGELMLNKMAFTGKPITEEIDSGTEKAGKVADWAWKAWMPGAFFVPESWYWEKIGLALRGAEDSAGRVYSVPQALASSVGIKIRSQDVESEYGWRHFALEKVQDAIEQRGRTLGRQLDRNIISQEEFDRQMGVLEEKMLRNAKDVEKLSAAEAGIADVPDDDAGE